MKRLTFAVVTLLLTSLVCGTTLQSQTPLDLAPPCDSQNDAHREAVKSALEVLGALREIESGHFISSEVSEVVANLELSTMCGEAMFLSYMTVLQVMAVLYEVGDIQLGIGNSEELAPLLETWRDWAEGFVSEELKTQIWLGSFSNYYGQGIEVGCESYLLPVDIGFARGRNTLAELTLALSALFDPEQNHPVADVETEDWIKELSLSVAGIHIDEGMAEVRLSGQLKGIGTCGDAILEAQILQTIFQFSDVRRARITDGETNLRQITDVSDRFSEGELKEYIYDRDDISWLRS